MELTYGGHTVNLKQEIIFKTKLKRDSEEDSDDQEDNDKVHPAKSI